MEIAHLILLSQISLHLSLLNLALPEAHRLRQRRTATASSTPFKWTHPGPKKSNDPHVGSVWPPGRPLPVALLYKREHGDTPLHVCHRAVTLGGNDIPTLDPDPLA